MPLSKVQNLLNEFYEEAIKVQDITLESIQVKNEVLQKLKAFKENIEKIQVRGDKEDGATPTVTEPEHPLTKDKVLQNLCGYLDTPSKESYETIKNLRLVCQKWNNHLSPRLFRRSIITKAEGDTSLSSFLEVLPNPETESFQSTKIDKTSLKIKSEWLENKPFLQWVQLHGHKFTDLTLSREVNFHTSVFPLLNWLPNLEKLHLKNINFNTSLKLSLKRLLVTSFRRDINKLSDSLSMLLTKVSKLDSLSIHSSQRSKFTNLFFSKIKENVYVRETLNSVRKLELIYLSEAASRNISHLNLFPSVTELRICLCNTVNLSTLLNCVRPNLMKLHLDLVTGFCEMKEFTWPERKLRKLEELIFTYSENRDKTDCESSSDNRQSCDSNENADNYYNYEVKNVVKVKDILNKMPKLKCWTMKQCQWKWVGGHYVSNDFTSRICVNERCYHQMGLLDFYLEGQGGLGNEIRIHYALEKVELGCCQHVHDLFLPFVIVFPNLKHLSIWIKSEELNKYLEILTRLDKLKWLKVEIGETIEDFSSAVNLNFPNFGSLEEFCLEKCSAYIFRDQNRHRPRYTQCVKNVDKAYIGFGRCQSLKILSFKELQIDRTEWETLAKELGKFKPNLALNEFNCFN